MNDQPIKKKFAKSTTQYLNDGFTFFINAHIHQGKELRQEVEVYLKGEKKPVKGILKCYNVQHGNFVIDTPEEHILFRDGWSMIKIKRGKK